MIHNREIALHLDGAPGEIELDALLKGAYAVLTLLRQPESGVRWVVSRLGMGSVDLAIRPHGALTASDRESIDDLNRTLGSLTRPTRLPETWGPSKVQALLDLAQLRGTSHVTGVSLTVGNQVYVLDETIEQNLQASLEAPLHGRPALGSVKGVLKRYNGTTHEVGIIDPLTGRSVKATFPSRLTRKVAALVEHTVLAWGELVRDEDGEKTRLRMRDLEDADAAEPPAPVEQMVGLYGPDWTEGLSSDEWVKRRRE